MVFPSPSAKRGSLGESEYENRFARDALELDREEPQLELRLSLVSSVESGIFDDSLL
jgi:hypothetical protein